MDILGVLPKGTYMAKFGGPKSPWSGATANCFLSPRFQGKIKKWPLPRPWGWAGSNFGVPMYPLGVPTYTTMKRLASLKLQASGAKKPLFLGSFWSLYRSRFPHRDFFETFFVKHTCPHIKNKKNKKKTYMACFGFMAHFRSLSGQFWISDKNYHFSTFFLA